MHPKLEYGIAAWNPYIKADINCIKQVQQNEADSLLGHLCQISRSLSFIHDNIIGLADTQSKGKTFGAECISKHLAR